jgi:hypothetical protein
MRTLYIFPALLLLAGIPVLARGDSVIPATIEATFDQGTSQWTANITGTFSEGMSVKGLFEYGIGADGMPTSKNSLGITYDPRLAHSPFSLTVPIAPPDPDWTDLGVGITISDSQGSTTEILSALFPIFWPTQPLIDHAWGTRALSAPNYEPGSIPPGIGIPHALINSLPDGDYYAVVFFSAGGCPSSNYQINAFRPGGFWGYDIRGPNAPYSNARSSKGGGCMQKFHIDTSKGAGWLWGALDPLSTSTAIADENSIPAFAICATATACDPVSPQTTAQAPATSTERAISNVLFLPGIKGSKLYEDNPLCLFPSDSCGIPLWLPLADAVVPELFLDAAGKSRRPVFVREGQVLGSAFGAHFYDDFLTRLGEEPSLHWKPAAYDWRLSLPDIIERGSKQGAKIYFEEATSSPYLVQTLKGLASSSPTGKVTIIAHSNGGLVAKALMASLGVGAAQLIDAVILIGVPQSGAPRALGALLYGDSEGIPGIKNLPNFIMSSTHAREFGLNSPMAYHLLPSAAYLNAQQLEHPLVRFDDSDLLAEERASFGDTIDSPSELRSYANGEYRGRSMPATDDLGSPNVLNETLLAYAANEHGLLDAWQPPAGIQVYELGGYGVNTISGIDEYAALHADGTKTLAYRPLFTQDGDGTVPVISALMMNASVRVHHLWLDMPDMRRDGNGYTHGNMLEAADIQDAILDILHQSTAYPSTVHAMDIASAPEEKELAIYVHSPVSLSVTDAQGRKSSIGAEGSTEDIPKSTSGTFGEVKYVVLPLDAHYTIELQGEGTGLFTLDVQEQRNGTVLASTTIADVPVTTSMRATFSINGSLKDTSALSIDEDGDGSEDLSIMPIIGTTTFPETTDVPTRIVRTGRRAVRKVKEYVTPLQAVLPVASDAQPQATPMRPHVLGSSTQRAGAAIPPASHALSVPPPSFIKRIQVLFWSALHFLLQLVFSVSRQAG